jgi:hypothetical protein
MSGWVLGTLTTLGGVEAASGCRQVWNRTLVPVTRPRQEEAFRREGNRTPNWSGLEWTRPHRKEAYRQTFPSGGVVRNFVVGASSLATSAIISVTAQNAGGDSTHPIGSVNGMAMRGSSPGRLGKMTASLGAELAASHTR